jgi:hypothetical protein
MTVDGKDVRGYANYLKTPNAPDTNQSLLKEISISCRQVRIEKLVDSPVVFRQSPRRKYANCSEYGKGDL